MEIGETLYYVRTYIISHYNPSVRIIDLVFVFCFDVWSVARTLAFTVVRQRDFVYSSSRKKYSAQIHFDNINISTAGILKLTIEQMIFFILLKTKYEYGNTVMYR